MVKRGPHLRPQASEGEAQHGLFCWTRRDSLKALDLDRPIREADISQRVPTIAIYEYTRPSRNKKGMLLRVVTITRAATRGPLQTPRWDRLQTVLRDDRCVASG